MTITPAHSQPTVPRQYLWVFVGGMIGTFARWLLSTALPRVSLAPSSGNYLWDIWGMPGLSLMLCNAVGAGLLAVLITMYPDAKSNPRLLWGTGALGAFTSYSALASLAAGLEASSAQLRAGMEAFPTFGEVVGGFSYCLVSLLVGMIAAVAGRIWGAGIRGTQVVRSPQPAEVSGREPASGNPSVPPSRSSAEKDSGKPEHTDQPTAREE